jgi:nucleotide-binding universal stress UspA family protein
MRRQVHDQGRIVVGVDGSRSSVSALRWALRQAELTGSTVEAVLVLDTTASLGMTMTVSPSGNLLVEADRSLTEAVTRATGGGPSVPVARSVEYGHPAAVLIKHAEHADLLVVGSHGLGGFSRPRLGSVSQHCIQNAACPVVVVRTGGE